ncbi:MAG: SUMF1/EgtB/PvdO family nonheme iron enzyme, partial [Myxococcales bacterium]|nr:SUMF1/EgtB/PvdO family nonheme iron enzyme [Myxococcales bacterium]
WMWCDAFVIQEAHVTNRDWLAFLDDLQADGRAELAERCAPRDYQVTSDGQRPFWEVGEDRRWRMLPDLDGDVWQPDWPIMMIDYASTVAYVLWRRERDGLPWRLPSELEWEKAARGVDGRKFPWGDRFDPTFAATEYHAGIALVAAWERPVDISPYGVRSMAGNIAEVCLEPGGLDLPDDPRVRIGPFPLEVPEHVASRGGSWSGPPHGVRSAARGFGPANRGLFTQGLRLARSFVRDL